MLNSDAIKCRGGEEWLSKTLMLGDEITCDEKELLHQTDEMGTRG